MTKRFSILAAFSLFALSLAVTSKAYTYEKDDATNLAARAVIHESGGTVAQPYVRKHMSRPREEASVINPALDRRSRVFRLHYRLQQEGVQFIRVGEDLSLVLQSENYFHKRSPKLLNSPLAKKRLWLIAQYLNCFDKISINVDAHTCDQGDPKRNLALSQQRANAIATQLEQFEVDTRLLLAKGMGGRHPIASNRNEAGRVANERIEISMRMLPPDNAVRQTAW